LDALYRGVERLEVDSDICPFGRHRKNVFLLKITGKQFKYCDLPISLKISYITQPFIQLFARCSLVVRSLFDGGSNNERTTSEQQPKNKTTCPVEKKEYLCIVQKEEQV
ncbi:MAG: hypothetical protein II509_02455, partial [Prevotella sp.]|nr:hypothetical protein [Prevotella sp.]